MKTKTNAKIEHQKWLAKRGLLPAQVSARKKTLGNPNKIPSYVCAATAALSNDIPSNGTKSPDISKAEFSKSNYAMVPAYNKGPIQPISKNEIQYAGKKL